MINVCEHEIVFIRKWDLINNHEISSHWHRCHSYPFIYLLIWICCCFEWGSNIEMFRLWDAFSIVRSTRWQSLLSNLLALFKIIRPKTQTNSRKHNFKINLTKLWRALSWYKGILISQVKHFPQFHLQI